MGPECALAIFECVTWRHYGLIAADRPALDLMADAAPDRLTPFPTVAEIVLTTLEQASEPIAPGTFRLDRLETDPRFACIDRPANAVFLCRFGLHFGGRSAHLDLLLPYAVLEPVRSRLRQMFRGEKFGCDAHWAAGLRAHLSAGFARHTRFTAA
jgi:flagellar motor switch protein FliM